MHEALPTERQPEDPHEDSLRGEALRVSAVQRQLQRLQQFASPHDEAHGAQDALMDNSIVSVMKLMLYLLFITIKDAFHC
jgi:hypothetical protein